jgi:hypothetical protein
MRSPISAMVTMPNDVKSVRVEKYHAEQGLTARADLGDREKGFAGAARWSMRSGTPW